MSRELWRPKLTEVNEQCVSCPFAKDNDAEFGEILSRLREFYRMDRTVTPFDIGFARLEIEKECTDRGDFSCHNTAYDANMNQKPRKKHRQCKGASEHYRKGPKK